MVQKMKIVALSLLVFATLFGTLSLWAKFGGLVYIEMALAKMSMCF
jgi:cell division protein FtsB